ncbi:MAG: hypothetical protein WKG07_29935 [Hymenobacter sp.]
MIFDYHFPHCLVRSGARWPAGGCCSGAADELFGRNLAVFSPSGAAGLGALAGGAAGASEFAWLDMLAYTLGAALVLARRATTVATLPAPTPIR